MSEKAMEKLESLLEPVGFEQADIPAKLEPEVRHPTKVLISPYAVVVAVTLPEYMTLDEFRERDAFYQEGLMISLFDEHPLAYPDGHFYFFQEGKPDDAALQEAIWDMERNTLVCLKNMIHTEDGRWNSGSCDLVPNIMLEFQIPVDKEIPTSVEFEGHDIPLDANLLLFHNDGAEMDVTARLQEKLKSRMWVPTPTLYSEFPIDAVKDPLEFVKWLAHLRAFAIANPDDKFFIPLQRHGSLRLVWDRMKVTGLSIRTVTARRGVERIRLKQRVSGQ